MLRLAVWLLLAANALYFAWTQGWLAAAGLAPAEQREPERLKAQVRPEALRLLNGPKGPGVPSEPVASAPVPPQWPTPATEALADALPAPAAGAPASAPASASSTLAAGVTPPATPATACWQASGFTPAQGDGLRTALAATGLPAGSWRLEEQRTGGRWVVYMGRYSDELMVRKKTELRELGVEFREVSVPALAPGLALGTFSSEAAAQQALRDLTKKGVNTARVAQERPEGSAFSLRLPAATEAQRASVQALGAALAGKRLQPCD